MTSSKQCVRCPSIGVKNSEEVIDYNLLPRLEISSSLSNVEQLIDIDADLQMPIEPNFNYYSTHDFHNNSYLNDCMSRSVFSILHCNVRSLSANFDMLVNLLSELCFCFSVIGLSEIKTKIGQNLNTNVDISGYHFISSPSYSNAGGVGLYINNHLIYKIRSDLTSTTDDYETLWIEIINNNERNILCGVVYRHPGIISENFMNHMNAVIEKIHHENKYCTIMGDFNIDLLKCEMHDETQNFLNALESFLFQPQILQPTRITDHSATLIDNIFFNSLDHFTISGNLISDLSDHLPNFLIIEKYSVTTTKVKSFKRDYSNFRESDLINQ